MTRPSTTACFDRAWPWMKPAPDDPAKRFVTSAVLTGISKREILRLPPPAGPGQRAGTGLTLPLDVEPTAPGIASTTPPAGLAPHPLEHRSPLRRLCRRRWGICPRSLLSSTTPTTGIRRRCLRLKNNLPELFAAAQKRFRLQPPPQVSGTGKGPGGKSGMPTTLTLGEHCVGRPCGAIAY